MAKAASENFPVAPLLLPRAVRRHLLAIYGFARLVDDIGDEAPGDRLAQLDRIEQDLDRIYATGPPVDDRPAPSHPLLVEVGATVRAFDIPPDPFRRLVQANRQDQTVSRYQRFEDLVAYCGLSANPVGHLVLYVFEAVTAERLELSDAICTALQLTEHWQDVAEDLARDRVYLPQEDLARFGVDHADLSAPRAGERVRRLLEFEVARTAELFDRGAPLVGGLRGRARLTIAGFLAGGRAALAAIAGCGYDVLSMSPKPTRRRLARELSSILLRKG
ncbi:MAG TPA: squalene synthase HpnC [Actinomycetota bacterium]|jgi:squalene synthase HpnC|nr:squalene synthase HpnC [Actinomycetota bacterium]